MEKIGADDSVPILAEWRRRSLYGRRRSRAVWPICRKSSRIDTEYDRDRIKTLIANDGLGLDRLFAGAAKDLIPSLKEICSCPF